MSVLKSHIMVKSQWWKHRCDFFAAGDENPSGAYGDSSFILSSFFFILYYLFFPSASPKRVPAEAQRKRVRWGKEEERSERSFSPLGENEGYGAIDDAGGGKISDFAGGVPAPQLLASTVSLRASDRRHWCGNPSPLLCNFKFPQHFRRRTAPKAPLCKGGCQLC